MMSESRRERDQSEPVSIYSISKHKVWMKTRWYINCVKKEEVLISSIVPHIVFCCKVYQPLLHGTVPESVFNQRYWNDQHLFLEKEEKSGNNHILVLINWDQMFVFETLTIKWEQSACWLTLSVVKLQSNNKNKPTRFYTWKYRKHNLKIGEKSSICIWHISFFSTDKSHRNSVDWTE